MAANFIEVPNEESTEEITSLDQVQNTTPAPAEEPVGKPEEVVQEPDLPEKYRNKTIDEIVKMHQEAEKLIGRQAQEVGESRKLLDDFIKQQLETKKHDTQPVQSQEIDWYEDPAKAVNQALENNPILKQLQEQQAQQAQQAALQQVEKAHPDFRSIVQSEDFINWVKGSRVRIQLLTQAENFDADAGLELLSSYKALKGISNQSQDQSKAADVSLQKAEEANRSKTLKAATVQQGGTGESTKPIYRREDIIRLKMQDPDRYESMADEILLAYAEKRVR